jgi:elongation factor G
LRTYEPGDIRNIALIGHRGSGKTSLAEALLYAAGAVERLGSVEAGTATTDFEPEEQARGMSVQTAVCFAEYDGTKINILDTPGYADFMPDVEASLSVVESAVLVVDGVAGPEVHTEKVYRAAVERGLPVICFVSKLDKENAQFAPLLDTLGSRLGCKAVPLYLPIGREASFAGLVDVLNGKAIRPDGTEGGVPEDMEAEVSSAHDALMEFIAEADDALLEKYLEGETLSPDELQSGLRAAVCGRAVMPVLCGTPTAGIGARELLDFVAKYAPSPPDAQPREAKNHETGETSACGPEQPQLAAVVFKTFHDQYLGRLNLLRVYSGTLKGDSTIVNATRRERERVMTVFALQGKRQEPVDAVRAGDIGAVAKLSATLTGDTLCGDTKRLQFDQLARVEGVFTRAASAPSRSDEEKMSEGIARLAEEDIGFTYHRDPETGELVVAGMGQLHLDIAIERLRRKFGVQVQLGEPKIPYRETIKGSGDFRARHKKQTGGRGQFGECALRIRPLPRGEGFKFANEIRGASIPNQYIPGVEKGVLDAMREGVVAGYPVVDVEATVYDGKDHPVDSSELAFKIAGSLAFRGAVEQASPVLLEPIVQIEVTTPDEFVGDIISDLNSKRGRVLGTDSQGSNSIVQAQVPLAEVLNYEAQLRSMTQGRASYSAKLSHYEEVPAQLAERITAQRKAEKK